MRQCERACTDNAALFLLSGKTSSQASLKQQLCQIFTQASGSFQTSEIFVRTLAYIKWCGVIKEKNPQPNGHFNVYFMFWFCK